MNVRREYFSDNIQCFSYRSTTYIYTSLIIALLPSILWGIYAFGYATLMVVMTPVVTALFIEYIVTALSKKYTPLYLHALWIGLLIGAFMPPRVALLIPFVSTAFAMLVVKWTFGGVEQCWINPAAAALVFARISFPRGYASGWVLPRIGYENSAGFNTVERALYRNTSSSIDTYLRELINNEISSSNIIIPDGFFDALLGLRTGFIGSISVILLLLGAVIIVAHYVVNWLVPLSAFIAYAIVVFIFDGDSLFTGNILNNVSQGAFLLGIFFLATDITSTIFRKPTVLLYGALIGLLAYLFQDTAGIAAAVLMTNVLCQLSINDRHYINQKIGKITS